MKRFTMKRALALGGLFAAGMLVGSVSTQFLHAQDAPYVTRPILKQGLNNLPGQELLLFSSTWQPGFRLPLHVHPNGHEVTFVVEGEQTFEIEGIGTKVVKAGEAIYTSPNTPHTSRNTGNTSSKMLVVRLKDADKSIAVDVKP